MNTLGHLSTRMEKDSQGENYVPKDAYYGLQSYRAFENFKISGMQIHPLMNHSYLLLKKAAALANKKLNVLAPQKADVIILAIDSLLAMDFQKHFIIDVFQAGGGDSQNTNTNEVIANKANELLGGELGRYDYIKPDDHVNMSQSTNDTYPTVMQLTTLSMSRDLVIELGMLAQAFERKSQEFAHVSKIGRTHLQDAAPMRLGLEFSAYHATMEQIKDLLCQAQGYLRILGIGGSTIGTGLNVPHGFRGAIITFLQELFHDPQLTLTANLFASSQSQLPMMVYSNALRICALELTRILNDLRLLNSGPHSGFGEVVLSASQLELGNQVMFKILGNDNAMALAMQAGQLELNAMMPLMSQLALESTQLLTHALHALREHCINGIRANIERCEKYTSQVSQLPAALIPIIGYDKAVEITRQAVLSKKTVQELLKETKLLTEDQINRFMRIKNLSI